MNLSELIKTKRLYCDGGTGTVLQSLGLPNGTPPEKWSLDNPEKITELHKMYIDAGANLIATNTFGVNSEKYKNYGEYIEKAVECAKSAAEHKNNVFVLYDIGPSGHLLKPMGDLGFEDAVSLFSDNVKVAEKCGVDGYLIETFNDIYELKAAILAVKENSDKPLFVSCAYSEDGRLMTGSTPQGVISLCEGMGADVIGMNCSFGPDKMLPVLEEYVKYSSLPVMICPNAGLPKSQNGKNVFDISADVFSDYMKKAAEIGACILGGCCGTTPEYIKKTVEKTSDIPYKLPEQKKNAFVCSFSKCVKIGQKPYIIGERINPTGKKLLKEALRSGDMGYILGEAVKQAEAGAHILDVNVGLPEIDEKAVMSSTVFALQTVTDLPLQLDSPSPEVLASAMRIYNGTPLVNSVDGNTEKAGKIFALLKKYGGCVIALTMDENGIPDSVDGRVKIAEKIVGMAKEYGIEKHRIVFDPLCLTVSSGENNGKVTLETVKKLHEMGYFTSLGVSNVSFGLPARQKLNMTYYAMALENGLDLAIINPCDRGMTDVYYSFNALKGLDGNFSEYIPYADEIKEDTKSKVPDMTLESAVENGMKETAEALSTELLKTKKPLDIINEHIIPALNKVGKGFEEKKVYLPSLLMSAEAASAAFEVIKRSIPKGESKKENPVILATVKGDIHDIGKNIVRVLLESYSFKVYDLGRDVPPETVLEKVKETGCRLVGLSALMTTTVPSMADTVKLLHEYDSSIKVVVGGAVLNEEYAKFIHADKYSPDAMETVRFAEEYYKQN